MCNEDEGKEAIKRWSPSEDVDVTSSELLSLNTPLHHEVIQFDWLHCKYSKRGSKTAGSSRGELALDEENHPGNIVARYGIIISIKFFSFISIVLQLK